MKIFKNKAFYAISIAIAITVTAILFLKNQTQTQLPLSPSYTPSRSIRPLQKTIEVMSGNVSVESKGVTKSINGTGSEFLTNGDIITTDDNSLALIHYDESTIVRLNKNTSVVYADDDKQQILVTQTVGSIYVRFKKILGKRESFILETPTASATVRGTAYGSFVKKSGETKIVVTKDSVAVARKDTKTGSVDEATTKIVGENQQARVNESVTVEPLSLDAEETKWIEFNKLADLAMDNFNAIGPIAAKLLEPTSTPTPKPVTPKPTKPPTPTSPPLAAIDHMPPAGYSRSSVTTDSGTFTLSCMGANKNTTRVITDSGNENTCSNNCNVLPLHEYANRNGGFAALNGLYYCPADYAWCADKVNSFDTLFFNSRSKTYLNSDNNVYSTIPFLVVEANGNPLFKRHSSEWGRDTGIMAGTAGNPLMILGGSNVLGDYSLDTKMQTVKSARTAFVSEGDTIYLCVVAGATVYDATKVYAKVGADNAINFDSGGSTAFWVNGRYIYGPGRNLATAIIFAHR